MCPSLLMFSIILFFVNILFNDCLLIEALQNDGKWRVLYYIRSKQLRSFNLCSFQVINISNLSLSQSSSSRLISLYSDDSIVCLNLNETDKTKLFIIYNNQLILYDILLRLQINGVLLKHWHTKNRSCIIKNSILYIVSILNHIYFKRFNVSNVQKNNNNNNNNNNNIHLILNETDPSHPYIYIIINQQYIYGHTIDIKISNITILNIKYVAIISNNIHSDNDGINKINHNAAPRNMVYALSESTKVNASNQISAPENDISSKNDINNIFQNDVIIVASVVTSIVAIIVCAICCCVCYLTPNDTNNGNNNNNNNDNTNSNSNNQSSNNNNNITINIVGAVNTNNNNNNEYVRIGNNDGSVTNIQLTIVSKTGSMSSTEEDEKKEKRNKPKIISNNDSNHSHHSHHSTGSDVHLLVNNGNGNIGVTPPPSIGLFDVNNILRAEKRDELFENFNESKVKFYRKCSELGLTDELIDILMEDFSKRRKI